MTAVLSSSTLLYGHRYCSFDFKFTECRAELKVTAGHWTISGQIPYYVQENSLCPDIMSKQSGVLKQEVFCVYLSREIKKSPAKNIAHLDMLS